MKIIDKQSGRVFNSRQLNTSVGVWKHYLDFMELLMNQFDNPDGPRPRHWKRIPVDSNKYGDQEFLLYKNGSIEVSIRTRKLNPGDSGDQFMLVNSNIGNGYLESAIIKVFGEALMADFSTMLEYRYKNRIPKSELSDKAEELKNRACNRVIDLMNKLVVSPHKTPVYISLKNLEKHGNYVLDGVAKARDEFGDSIIKICDRYLRDHPEPNLI